jgi:putative spermidine/putrescine transport system substrate-binding protein
MKRTALAVVVIVLAGALSAAAQTASFKGQTLRVQFWGGADGTVIQRHIVDPFVKETGAVVVVENGNTSASIAKARAQKGDPQLDVIFLDDIGVLTLAREDILEKLDLAKMPQAKEIHPTYRVGDGYGIGIFNYITTILYNDKVVTAPPKSWRELWDPKYRGKVLVTPITHTQGLLLTVMAARLGGGSLDNLAAAWPKLRELRPNIHSQVENRAVGAELLKSGEALLSVEIPYYYKAYIERGYPIAMTTDLEEGFFSITGAACLVKGGKASRDLAYAFINRALTAEAQSRLAEDLWYGPTNPNAKLAPQAARFMVHKPEQYTRAIQVDRLKLLELRPMIIDEWNKIMTQ